MNKRGSVFETLDMAQIVFALSFTIIIVGVILFNMSTIMATIPIFQSGGGATGLNFIQNYPTFMDWMPLAIYTVMLIGSIYAARQATERGLSMLISYFFVFLITVVIMVLGYILDTMFNSAALSSFSSQLPITAFYAEYALIFGVFYALFVLIALHGGSDE